VFCSLAKPEKGACTLGQYPVRGIISSTFAAVCETQRMRRRFIFVVLCLAITVAPAALGQNIRPAAEHLVEPRPITKTEGRKILAISSTVGADSESETDCSHFVHDVYEQAGFPYDYVSSRELYIGNTNFMRVHKPQAGDLVVWRGHVGVVIDSKEHSFFSSVRSGPDTQFYDSPYWRSRGIARFYRYMTEKPLRSSPTLEATRDANHEPFPAASRGSENRQPSKLRKPLPSSTSAPAADPSGSGTFEVPREIVLQAAGKNPTPAEVADGFIEMNQDCAKSLRTRTLNNFGKPIIIYRDLRVSAVQIKGKHGTALVSIESLGTLPDSPADSQPRWKEESLEFQKMKRGWVMSPVQEVAYVSREVALQVLSARLAELAQNTGTTPAKEREQKQIIRFLNALIPDNSRAESAQSN
jgi:NlpC/P60 family